MLIQVSLGNYMLGHFKSGEVRIGQIISC